MLRSQASRRRTAVLGPLLAASAFGYALAVARMAYTGTPDYANLLWNLVLAWVPAGAALLVYDGARRGRGGLALLAPAFVWLLFLPNAPYLVTDFLLLREIGGAPVWFDVVLLTTFAWTGLLLGFLSLYLVQAVIARRAGPAVAWGVVLSALALSSFGIYLGRFVRWNSWDVVVRPTAVAADVWSRLSAPTAQVAGMTAVLTGFLTVAYLVLYAFARLARAEER